MYTERVDLAASTTLAGLAPGSVSLEGPIVNYGHQLRVRNLKIGSPTMPAVLSVGASSLTDLRCVAIENPGKRGVQQAGGRLVADWLTVRGARADGESETGVGVLVGDGAKAELRNVALSDHGAQALVARGRGTVAVIDNLYVANTRWHPALETLESAEDLRATGALHVGEGATLFASSARLENNCLFGVLVTDLLSGAHLTEAVVDSTRSVAELESRGGIGVAVRDAAALELRSFTLEHAELCGLQIEGDCWASAADGDVRHNAIGVCLQGLPFPIELISAGVEFADNGINLDAPSPPVPDFDDPFSDSDDTPPADSRKFPGRTHVRWQDPYRFPLRLLDGRRLRDLFGPRSR